MEMERSWLKDDPARRERWKHLLNGQKIDGNDRTDRKGVRLVTEVLLDSEKRAMDEDVVTTGVVGPFTTFAFPLVRRVFPRLLANDLVSVQPMQQPTGKIFFFDTTYSGNVRRDIRANFDKNYATTGENTSVKELGLEISSVDVSAETKKLKAKWTLESAQDLRAYHDLNAEDELMAGVADELVREIDRTIIDDIVANVPGANKLTWAKAVPTSGAYSNLDPKVYGRTLWSKILDANQAIFAKRYVNATWIVTGNNASNTLEKLDEFTVNPTSDPTQWQMIQGAHFLGTLGNRWMVFKDPWLDDDTIVMGYKGPGMMQTGYVYSPYIPIFTTPILTDPEDFTSRRGMMSRYAKTMVIPDLFASITLT